MTTEDERGLLSRMVRFVRNPSASWSDLDNSELDSESRYSKQMLKDMIERRRRNDFVRKREFDMLRKLRRDGVTGDQEGGARPSYFQSSSIHQQDDRAKTIKKIDEIEAQMSQQWWKTKTGDISGHGDAKPDSPNTDFSGAFTDQPGTAGHVRRPLAKTARPIGAPVGGAATAVNRLAAVSFLPTEVQSKGNAPITTFTAPTAPTVFTAPTKPSHPAAPLKSASPAPIRASQVAGLTAHPDGQVTGFSYSKLNAFQVAEFTHDPLLEEAAIRFANADDEGAEAALQEALRNPDPAISGNQAIWMTLFDLFRATDNQDGFESVSLDFANRFGRSGPIWLSFLGNARKHVPVPVVEPNADTDVLWSCPPKLDTKAMTRLKSLLERSPQPWSLNWSLLGSIEDTVVEPLLKLVTAWTNQSVKLRFTSTRTLMDVLKEGTVTGEAHTNPMLWRLRMEMLRIMHRPDEFEVVALDYCVTYEVSPPSWEGALCNFKTVDGSHSHLSSPPTIVGEVTLDGASSSLPTEDFTEAERAALQGFGGVVRAVDLSGVIMGDAVEMLDKLNAKLEGSDLIVVLCSRLVRLDFLAAGTLLNWASARQAEGRQVHFKDLHRLVAVFFNVIGISEHAKVSARTD
jgi:hypothetical protein